MANKNQAEFRGNNHEKKKELHVKKNEIVQKNLQYDVAHQITSAVGGENFFALKNLFLTQQKSKNTYQNPLSKAGFSPFFSFTSTICKFFIVTMISCGAIPRQNNIEHKVR